MLYRCRANYGVCRSRRRVILGPRRTASATWEYLSERPFLCYRKVLEGGIAQGMGRSEQSTEMTAVAWAHCMGAAQ